MPLTPSPRAVPHVWKWKTLFDIAARSGDLVPVGRGGERRAVGLVNPGLPGTAHATPTLWAAIQYLGGFETAPEHGTARTPSASWSRAKVYGPSSTATPSPCAAGICC